MPGSKRGLGSADRKTREEVGRKGGQASHPHGRGLQNVDPKRREEIARMGGESRGEQREDED